MFGGKAVCQVLRDKVREKERESQKMKIVQGVQKLLPLTKVKKISEFER